MGFGVFRILSLVSKTYEKPPAPSNILDTSSSGTHLQLYLAFFLEEEGRRKIGIISRLNVSPFWKLFFFGNEGTLIFSLKENVKNNNLKDNM